jgi:hypothetical protein
LLSFFCFATQSQSAFAHHVLVSQLTQVGVTPDSLNRDIDMVFNDSESNGAYYPIASG